MKKSKKITPEPQISDKELYTHITDDLYQKSFQIFEWLRYAVKDGTITDEEFEEYKENYMDILMVFMQKSKYRSGESPEK